MPGKSHRLRSLVGYSPWGCKESDTTEWLLCVSVCVCWFLSCLNFWRFHLCPLNWWCHPTVCCPLLLLPSTFQASGSFQMSKLFTSSGQSIRVSASASVLPVDAAAAAKLLQSRLTLCNPIGSSPPGSPVPGILQARTLEWVAISFSSAWKWKVKVKLLSHVRLLVTPWTAACQFPGKSTIQYWFPLGWTGWISL